MGEEVQPGHTPARDAVPGRLGGDGAVPTQLPVDRAGGELLHGGQRAARVRGGGDHRVHGVQRQRREGGADAQVQGRGQPGEHADVLHGRADD